MMGITVKDTLLATLYYTYNIQKVSLKGLIETIVGSGSDYVRILVKRQLAG